MKRYISLSILSVLIVFFIAAGLFYKPSTHYPFKCYGFIEYNLVLDNKEVQLNLSQDIRLYDDKTGEISFSGRVMYDNRNTVFNRKIMLTNTSRLDEDTLKFTIKKTVKSLSDNTPDDFYNLLMDEYVASQHTIQIDLIEIVSGLWVIGSPTSFIMICQAY